MRAHVFVLLLMVARQCAARHLRQLTVQCPEELTKPVLAYMNSAKYKDAVAKACAKRKLLSAVLVTATAAATANLIWSCETACGAVMCVMLLESTSNANG